MRILCLTRYADKGASSRLRFLQYSSYLESEGFCLDFFPLLDNLHLQKFYSGKRSWTDVSYAYSKRFFKLQKAKKYDLIWLEKEAFPRFPSWFEAFSFPQNIPLVVDYDDAVFHQYDLHLSKLFRYFLSHKIDSVMARSNLVVAGNDYIASRALKAGARRVEIIPTVIDTLRYQVSPKKNIRTPLVIGWIGSPATAHYLHLLYPIFESFADAGVHFIAIGAKPSQVAGTPFKAVPWDENKEVQSIQQFDIGIMPLSDAPFERGKCGYKLLQYMACGKPVVASPIGVNRLIVQHGENGFLADTSQDWQCFLQSLIEDADLRKKLGDSGRAMVEKDYSLKAVAPRLAQLLRLVAKEG